MYSLEFTKSSVKFLRKIPHKDKEIVLKKLSSLRENPYRYLKKLQGSKLWRLRIMKYRAVVDVVVSGNRIVVLRIGYRKNIYSD